MMLRGSALILLLAATPGALATVTVPLTTVAFEALKQKHPELVYTSEEWVEFQAHFERHMGEEELLLGAQEPYAPDEKAELVFLDSRPAVSQAMAEEVNKKPNGKWSAEVPERFRGLSFRDAKKMMGTFVGEKMVKLPARDTTELSATVPKDLPASFDARTKWPECPIIAHVRDQANCGSCWAFGSTEAFNDRICIASGGKFKEELSAQHTASCCNFLHCLSMGCNGGQIGLAWRWLTNNGVVSGGDYGDQETCWPYELAPCAHHVNSTKYPACPGEVSTPSCRSSCSNTKYATPFAQDVVQHSGDSAYSLGSVDEIKQSILEKGPVSAGFTVYSDFPTYKSGVYSHVSGSALGGHAVKILGWGTEGGDDYWIVANSWNPTWGDNGFFKIKQGDCGIDDGVHAGDVKYATEQAMTMVI